MDNAQALLELAGTLARQAGHAIMGVRAQGFSVTHKSDASPVTVADTIAEALITEGLLPTGIPIVAEEATSAGICPEPAPLFWLVDPLDGTKEFAKGRDEFCVCIGLVQGDAPLLGVLYLPVTGELFGGLVPERAAWKETSTGRHPISTRPPPPEGLHVLDSRSHAKPEALARMLGGTKVAETRPMGSAMKFARVAEGAYDLAPRPGPTMEWDTAAGQAVLEAAGGRVTTLDGAPMRYGKPGYLNAGFIGWGR
jgi:3'(2'), 5'-bisphosphate nucleotidase